MRKHFWRLSCVLAMIIAFSAFIIPTQAAYENTYKNTGNQRVDIIGVAKTQVGNTNSSHKYRNDNNAWCASFVVWCARQAGIDSSIIKTTGWATADDLGVTYKGRSADRKVGINYTPQSGDLIFFDWESDGYNYQTPASAHGDHVGLVEYVNNGYVYTIEGNSYNQVRRCSYSLSSKNIKGYGVPNYKYVSTTSNTSTKKNSTTKQTSSTNNYWTTNFRMKSGAYTNAYSAVGGSKVGRVYPGDVVTVQAVYDSGWMKLSCPWTGGVNKIVYVKASEFKYKATKYINAYSGANNSKVGRVYPNDLVTVQAIYRSGYMKCRCPWTGNTMKTIYVKVAEIY